MILETLSGTLTKAVPIYARGFEFSTVETREDAPSGDGVHDLVPAGVQRTESSRILALPYCLGCPGSNWWMRVSGWWNIGKDPNTLLWIRTILSTTLCVAGRQKGFAGRLLNEEERLAVSSVLVPTLGAKKIEFEFAYDLARPVDMNCFWAIA